ncbi:MAG: YfiR family protein [Thermonemataceae bacterium]|nr:YfiR family protein [Thermonemataceae bacterium]
MLHRYLTYIVFLVILGIGERAQAQSLKNYAYHPTYIYNFCRFTQWPQNKTQITIGVLGNSPIQQGLQKMAATKSNYNLKFVVKRFNTVSEINGCDVLFVPYATNTDIKQVHQKIVGKSVMLITENEQQKEYACFNFIGVNGKLMYQINKSQCEKSNLKVSQKLYALSSPL